MPLYDDSDAELSLKVLHNCTWFNPADNDDPFVDRDFLCYEFSADTENVVVLADIDDPLSATVMCPEFGQFDMPDAVRQYLWKRFDWVEQSTGDGRIALWTTRNL